MKNQNYSWLWAILFFGVLFVLVFCTNSDSEESISQLEITDVERLNLQVKNTDFDIIRVCSEDDSFIMDSNLDSLKLGQVYLRVGEMLDLIDNRSIELLLKNGDAKWVKMEKVLLRSFKLNQHVFTDVDVLLLNGVVAGFEKKTYVTFKIKEPIKINLISGDSLVERFAFPDIDSSCPYQYTWTSSPRGFSLGNKSPQIINTEIHQNSLYEGENILDSIVSVKIITNERIQDKMGYIDGEGIKIK